MIPGTSAHEHVHVRDQGMHTILMCSTYRCSNNMIGCSTPQRQKPVQCATEVVVQLPSWAHVRSWLSD